MSIANWAKGLVENSYDFIIDAYDATKGKVDEIYETKTKTQGGYDQRTSWIAAGVLEQKTGPDDMNVTYRRPSEGFSAYSVYRNFTDGVALNLTEVEDMPKNKATDLITDHVKSWGVKMRTTEDRFAASLFRRGGFTEGYADFNAVYGSNNFVTNSLAYDSKPAFTRADNLRTSKGGGTYHNALAVGLNVTTLGTLYDRVFVENAYDERDEEIETASMGTIALVFPPQLRRAATQAVESEYLPGVDTNDVNPLYKACKLVEWSLLRANATAWYLGVLKQGITFYRRGVPQIRFFRDEDSGAYKASARVRYGWMFWNFRFWGGSNVPLS
mgnify:FL=1